MKYVIYTGIIFMPDKNAAAQRATALCRIWKELGYIPVVIGMTHDRVNDILLTRNYFNGIIYYESHYPETIFQWLNTLIDSRKIKKVMNELGINDIEAVIGMDCFSAIIYQLNKFCRKSGIKYIEDTVDWFEKSSYRFPKNVIKDADTCVRMRILHKRMKKLIVISQYLKKYYNMYVKDIAEIPGVIDTEYVKNKIFSSYKMCNIVNFVFVGSSTNQFEKEKLDWMMRIVCKQNRDRLKCKFSIIGMDEKLFREERQDLVSMDCFDDSVAFLGCLPHDECLNMIREADFSVIIRKDSLLSQAGFPTKLAESFACGTPVLVTPSGNIKDYIPDGYGIIAEDCTEEALEIAVNKVLKLNAEDILKMHETVDKSNPLDCLKFTVKMQEILK